MFFDFHDSNRGYYSYHGSSEIRGKSNAEVYASPEAFVAAGGDLNNIEKIPFPADEARFADSSKGYYQVAGRPDVYGKHNNEEYLSGPAFLAAGGSAPNVEVIGGGSGGSGGGGGGSADLPIVGPIIGQLSESTGFSPTIIAVVGVAVALWLFSGRK